MLCHVFVRGFMRRIAQPSLPTFAPSTWGGSVASSVLFGRDALFPEAPKGLAVSVPLGILVAVASKHIIVYELGGGFVERFR